MSVNIVEKRFLDLIQTIGKAELNALYPDDFEFYLISLELFELKKSGDKDLIGLFIFPIMPESMSHNDKNIVSVKKTATKVISLKNPTFNPIDISLSGNFGRRLKILFGQNQLNTTNFFLKKDFPEKGINNSRNFDVSVKTGYGIIQMLRKILDLSRSINTDSGLPYQLVYTNLSLNTSYIVEYLNMDLKQSMQMNAIWNYTLNLKAIKPNVIETQKRSKLLTNSIVTNITNKLASDLQTSLSSLVQTNLSYTPQ